MKKIIERYKQIRKNTLLGRKYAHNYAFIGMGTHALQNLYPIVNYLHVPLKYIVTRTEKSASLAHKIYPNCEGTTNIDKVLADESVKGVFICATPKAHYNLVQKVLSANKHVFVEKPPCFTLKALNSLIEVQKKNKSNVFVGLQRRYAPAFSILKNKLKNVNHYVYRYVTGGYPEGDALFELFIHPIDTVNFLFGKAEVTSYSQVKNTYLLNVRHENGVIGNIELSADYSWKESFEYLSVNTNSGIFILDGLHSLVFQKKPKIIANIPSEKITTFASQHTLLFNRNIFIPNIQNNELLINGFYGELKSFVDFCESEDVKLNKSGLYDIRNSYIFLNQLNNT